MKKVAWVLGRYIKDKYDDMYIATDFVKTNRGSKVKEVKFEKVEPNTLQVYSDEVNEKQVNAHILVALRLIIDYHEDQESQYGVDDKISEQSENAEEPGYKAYDFIEFNPNYFTDESGNKIDTPFLCIVLQKYIKYDNATSKYIEFYDLLFEKELWNLEVNGVNENTSLVTNATKKKEFLSKVVYKKNLLRHLYTELDVDYNVQRVTQKRVPTALATSPKKKTRKNPYSSKTTRTRRTRKQPERRSERLVEKQRQSRTGRVSRSRRQALS